MNVRLSRPWRARSRAADLFAARLRLEPLEERWVPSHLKSGTILTVTFPEMDLSVPRAIVAVDPHTGAQNVVSSGGDFEFPIDLREGPDGDLFVVDYGAFHNAGAVFRVDPDTGAQTVISTGGYFLQPTGIQLVHHHIYVADEGSATSPGDVVGIDPATGAQTLIASGGDLCAPDGLTAGPHDTLYVVDFNAFTTGAVFQIDIRTGAQRVVATGGYIDEPVDVSVDDRGDLIVTNTGSTGVSNVIRVDPQTGAQTLISSGGNLVNANASTLAPSGKVLVTSYEAFDGSSPARLVAVNPQTGHQRVITEGGDLAFVGGVIVYERPDDDQGSDSPGGLDSALSTSAVSASAAWVPSDSTSAVSLIPSDLALPALALSQAARQESVWPEPGWSAFHLRPSAPSVESLFIDSTLLTSALAGDGM